MIAFHSPGGLRRKLEQNSYVLRLRKRKKKIIGQLIFPQVAQIYIADLSHSNGNFVLYIDFQVY